MGEPTDVNGEAVEVVAKARYERLYNKSARWDELHAVVREQYLVQTSFDLEVLASARRWEPCPTCGESGVADFPEIQCSACGGHGTIDAGSLAVAWLIDAGVLKQVAWEMCEHGAHPGRVYGPDQHAGRCPDCKPVFREVMP